MSSLESLIGQNLARIQDRLATACHCAGHAPSDVQLVGVTKYAELAWVGTLIALGVTHLGESRPQQLVSRAALLPPELHWHLIGHLQRNKVRLTLPAATLIHSVDSVRLLEQIARVAAELGLLPRVLIEVNLTGDPNKHGFSEADLVANWGQIAATGGVRIEGLMTMAAFSDNPQESRPTFSRLRELRDELARQSPPEMRLPELSMGMTGDFEVAVEEGATLVRVGSALWQGIEATKEGGTP